MSTSPQLEPRPSRDAWVAREDLVLFINASFACTAQDEFYGDSAGQAVSIAFLHDYILGNYRRLYGRTLAVGINEMNRAEVVFRLLQAGAPLDSEARLEEGRLIRASLTSLSPPRALRLFARLQRRRVNNRRTRAVIRSYLEGRRDPDYDAVKYRSKVGRALRHGHVKCAGERGRFLFGDHGASFETALFDHFRQAHFSQSALYELPFTVAEGFAAKHGIARKVFLEKIEPRLTESERLRLQRTSERELGTSYEIDLSSAPLTRLALYLLSIPAYARREGAEEFGAALEGSARRAARSMPLGLGRVACVLDRSYSSSGSSVKKRRPLALALGASALIREIARESQSFWSAALDGPEVAVTPRGQTNLVDPLLEALAFGPDLVVIVSDGHENDPAGAVDAVVEAFRRELDPEHRVSFVHVNPVFDAELFEPRTLGPMVPTVGVRDASDLGTMLAFARFVDGGSDLTELEEYLAQRVARFLGPDDEAQA